MKIRDGNVKDILKRAVEPLIPEGITNRPKEGFVLPIFDWMVDKLRRYSTDVLSDSRITRHGFFNNKTIKRVITEYYGGKGSMAVKVWNLMMFQIWWERYFR
jgi:asparagine synthase (glutamine-hydrolysing)